MSVSSILTLGTGLTFGITGVLFSQLRNDKDLNYDDYYDSWIASMAVISGAIGCLYIGTILDVFGRKKTQIILGLPYIIGWLFLAFSTSATYILIGRFITGLAAGPNRSLSSVYIGEILEPKYRSVGLVLPSLIGNIGSLLSHVIGSYLPWRIAMLVMIAPAVIGVIPMFFVKESPMWLIAKGRTDEAIETFRWFRGTDDKSEEELAAVIEKQKNNVNMSTKQILTLIFSKSFIKPFLTLLVIMLNIQFCGVTVINVYSEEIFVKMYGGKFDTFGIMVTADCIRAIASALICIGSKNMPRKKCLVGFNAIVIVSLAVLITYISLDLTVCPWITVLCMVIYITSSSIIVTLGYSFIPEIMPNKLRGFGSGVVAFLSLIFLFVAVKISPGIMNAYSEGALFGVFVLFCAVSGIILIFTLPETSGKTLQSIEDSYTDAKKENCNKVAL